MIFFFRSSKAFYYFDHHKKCPVNLMCSLCLTRSLICRINEPKGRRTIIPHEMESIKILDDVCMDRKWSFFYNILHKCVSQDKQLQEIICPAFKGLSCKTIISNHNKELWLQLYSNDRNINIMELIDSKLESLKIEHSLESTNEDCHKHSYIVLEENQKTCIINSWSMKIDLNENLFFGGKFWKCISVATNSSDCYFRNGHVWYLVSDQCNVIDESTLMNVSIAVFEVIDLQESILPEIIYAGGEIEKLRNKNQSLNNQRT